MASLGEPEDIYDIKGPQSLLDTIKDRNMTLDKKEGLIHRMVTISKMYHNNFSEIGQFYDKYFKDIQNQHQSTESISGLLLLYPKHCVHVVEGTMELLLDYLRLLRSEAKTGSEVNSSGETPPQAHMEKSKILLVSHDIPNRLHQQWSFRVMDIEAPNLDDYETSDESRRLVLDMVIQLLKLGAHIARQPKMALKNAMESLHDKVPELLPQQDVIGYLLEKEEEVIITPQQFLNKYEQPYDVVLASEMVWPMPVRLFPYN